jgi:thiamine-phosphate pyrophosphorylase
MEAARRAELEGADYLVAGPVFETSSHSGSAAAGIVLIEQITGAVSIPVIGIGGITYANAANVVRAGASGIAVISAILAAPDCGNAARKLREVLSAAWFGVYQVTP